jgi:SPOR domain
MPGQTRRRKSRNWVPGLFASFWVLLAVLSGLYLHRIVTDPAARRIQSAFAGPVAAPPSVPRPAEPVMAPPALSPDQAATLLRANEAKDRELSELKSALRALSGQVTELNTRLKPIEKVLGPVAALPSSTAVTTSEPSSEELMKPTEAAPQPPKPEIKAPSPVPNAKPPEPVKPLAEPTAKAPEPAKPSAEPTAKAPDPAKTAAKPPEPVKPAESPKPIEKPSTPSVAAESPPPSAKPAETPPGPAKPAETPPAREVAKPAPQAPKQESTVGQAKPSERPSAQASSSSSSSSAPSAAEATASQRPSAPAQVSANEPAAPAVTTDTAALSAPPPIPPGTTRFGIELGSVEGQDRVRPLWRDLLTNHSALVAGLQARRIIAPDKKWRLIAGPFSSAAEAMQACTLFKKANMPCEATVFAGDAL